MDVRHFPDDIEASFKKGQLCITKVNPRHSTCTRTKYGKSHRMGQLNDALAIDQNRDKKYMLLFAKIVCYNYLRKLNLAQT